MSLHKGKSFKSWQWCILLARFDNIRLELDDVNECFELVKNLVMDTPAEPYFLSVLQHLVCIRYLLPGSWYLVVPST